MPDEKLEPCPFPECGAKVMPGKSPASPEVMCLLCGYEAPSAAAHNRLALAAQLQPRVVAEAYIAAKRELAVLRSQLAEAEALLRRVPESFDLPRERYSAEEWALLAEAREFVRRLDNEGDTSDE